MDGDQITNSAPRMSGAAPEDSPTLRQMLSSAYDRFMGIRNPAQYPLQASPLPLAGNQMGGGMNPATMGVAPAAVPSGMMDMDSNPQARMERLRALANALRRS